MSRLDAAAMLDAWEAGLAHPPVVRSLLLLDRLGAEPDAMLRTLAPGEIERRLLALRERLFGRTLDCEARCPACDERLEFAVATTAIGQPPADTDGTHHRVRIGERAVVFRLPTMADVLAVLTMSADGDARRHALAARCIVAGLDDGVPLDEGIVAALAAAMAPLDPQAGVTLALTCPACERSATLPLDVGAFLWHEVERFVGRALEEVHALATAYGWSERDVLGLSATRRRFYLDRVGC